MASIVNSSVAILNIRCLSLDGHRSHMKLINRQVTLFDKSLGFVCSLLFILRHSGLDFSFHLHNGNISAWQEASDSLV